MWALVWKVVFLNCGGTGGGCGSPAGFMSWLEALSVEEPIESMLERKAIWLEFFVDVIEEIGREGRVAGPD